MCARLLLLATLGMLASGTPLTNAATAAGEDAPVGAAAECNSEQLNSRITECVAKSQDFISCQAKIAPTIKDPYARNCACFGEAPSLDECLGACFAVAKAGLCETVENAALAEAQAAIATATQPGKVGGGTNGKNSASAHRHDPRNDGTCDKTFAGLKVEECLPEDDAVVQCIKDGGAECGCFQASSIVKGCLGDCLTPILAAICPPGTVTNAEIAAATPAYERGEAAAVGKCSDVQAVIRLQTCSKQANDFIACMGGEGADECACLTSSTWLLSCLDDCKDAVISALDCKPACTAASASAKLKACASQSKPFVACLKGGRSECECLNDPSTTIVGCLGQCAVTVTAGLGCDTAAEDTPFEEADGASSREDAAVEDDESYYKVPSEDEKKCDTKMAAKKLQSCASEDPGKVMVTCLKDGKSECECIANAPVTMACLEDCLEPISKALECPPIANAVAASGTCDISTMSTQLQDCVSQVAADPDSMLVTCLKAHAGMAGAECKCMSESMEMRECLGVCWDSVQKTMCDDGINVNSNGNGDGNAAPAPPAGAGDARSGSGTGGGTCDAAAAMETAKTCVTADAGALQCIQKGGNECDCLKAASTQSPSLRACFGSCWQPVLTALCTDGTQQTDGNDNGNGNDGNDGSDSSDSDRHERHSAGAGDGDGDGSGEQAPPVLYEPATTLCDKPLMQERLESCSSYVASAVSCLQHADTTARQCSKPLFAASQCMDECWYPLAGGMSKAIASAAISIQDSVGIPRPNEEFDFSGDADEEEYVYEEADADTDADDDAEATAEAEAEPEGDAAAAEDDNDDDDDDDGSVSPNAEPVQRLLPPSPPEKVTPANPPSGKPTCTDTSQSGANWKIETLKACTADDPAFNPCMEANSVCECLLEEGHTRTCLGDCVNPVVKSVGCPLTKEALKRSKQVAKQPPAEGEDAETPPTDDHCESVVATAKLKECVKDNAAVRDCLQEGEETHCHCITKTSPTLRECMGTCWSTVNDALMCEAPTETPPPKGSGGEARSSASPAFSHNDISDGDDDSGGGDDDDDDDDTASLGEMDPDGPWYDGPGSGYGAPPADCNGAKMQECMAKDPSVMQCIDEGDADANPCHCFMGSRPAKTCLGECWVHVLTIFECPAEKRPKSAAASLGGVDASVEGASTHAPAPKQAKKATKKKATKKAKKIKKAKKVRQATRAPSPASQEALIAAKAEALALERENTLLKSQLEAEREMKKLRDEIERLNAQLGAGSGGTRAPTPTQYVPPPPAPRTSTTPTPAPPSRLPEPKTKTKVECTNAETTQKFRSCMSKDKVTVSCIKGGGNQCECLSKSKTISHCLNGCWPHIRTALKCEPPGPQGPAQCSDDQASVQLKDCVSTSPETLECLGSGKTQCECLSSTPDLTKCLGSCMAPISRALQCSGNGNGNGNTGAGGAVPQCDAQVVSKELQACVSKDPTAVKCLEDGGDSCDCVLASSPSRTCVGPCWGMIIKVLGCPAPEDEAGAAASTSAEPAVYIAPDDPSALACADSVRQLKGCVAIDSEMPKCIESGKDRCTCFAESSSMPTCAGTCWKDIVQALGCKTTSVMPAHHPLYVAPRGAYTAEQMAEAALNQGRANANGVCDSKTATSTLKACIAESPDVITCLREGRTQCECLAKSVTAHSCLGSCWNKITGALGCDKDLKVVEACDAEEAGALLKSCIAEDAKTLTCLKEGKTRCQCLQASQPTRECLGECWATIDSALGCAKARAGVAAKAKAAAKAAKEKETSPSTSPSPPEVNAGAAVKAPGATQNTAADSPGEEKKVCHAARAGPVMKACVAKDADAVACLKSGKGQCECLGKSQTIPACLDVCWETIWGVLNCDKSADERKRLSEASAAEAVRLEAEVIAKRNKIQELGKKQQEARKVCNGPAAGPLLKACVAKDAATVTCLKDGGTQCNCLTSSTSVNTCLGPCWATVITALKCKVADAAAVAQPSPSPSPSPQQRECTAQESMSILKACVKVNRDTTACLNSGKDECECIDASSALQQCLGHCFGLIVETMGCPVPAPTPAQVAATEDCDVAGASAKLKTCVARDKEAVACLRSGTPQCDCLHTSSSISTCMGGCWPTVVSAMKCTAPPPGSSGGGSSGAPPALAECSQDKSQEMMRACLGDDAKVLQCLEGGGSHCDCLLGSSTAVECLGPCIGSIVSVLQCGVAPPGGVGGGDVDPRGMPMGAGPGGGTGGMDEGEGSFLCDHQSAIAMLGDCTSADGDGKVATCIAEGGTECDCINQHRADMEKCMADCFPIMMGALCPDDSAQN